MSCLDAFIISHFEEKNEFMRVTEKGLLLNKVNFSEKWYKIDKQKFPWIPNKIASPSDKGKKKVDELINLSDNKEDQEIWEDLGMPGLGDDRLEGNDDEEEEEAKVGGGAILLGGAQLKETAAGEEHSSDLAKAILKGTP